MPDIETSPKVTKEEALNTVRAALQEVTGMGANDYEIPALNKLISDLEEGVGDPAVIAQKARDIQFSKQDYH